MLLLQTLVFPGVALVVRARLALRLGFLVGSPGCLPDLALLRARGGEGFPTIRTVVGHQPTSIVTSRTLDRNRHPIFGGEFDYPGLNPNENNQVFVGGICSVCSSHKVE